MGTTLARLVLLAAPAYARRIQVPYWTDDAGYCNAILKPDGTPYSSGVHRLDGLEPIHMVVDDTLVFTYATNHDVWQHPSKESLDACEYEGATELAHLADGGGCEDDGDFECMAAASGFEWRARSAGEFYFSCSVGSHCTNGQRLVVIVHAKSDGLPALPSKVPVPYWTEDAGFCNPIVGQDPHLHRPQGLDDITITEGQTLVFQCTPATRASARIHVSLSRTHTRVPLSHPHASL